jgi:hypothetical protein
MEVPDGIQRKINVGDQEARNYALREINIMT